MASSSHSHSHLSLIYTLTTLLYITTSSPPPPVVTAVNNHLCPTFDQDISYFIINASMSKSRVYADVNVEALTVQWGDYFSFLL